VIKSETVGLPKAVHVSPIHGLRIRSLVLQSLIIIINYF